MKMNAATLIAVPQAKELEPLLRAFSDAAGHRSKRVTLGKLEAYLFEEFALLFAVGGHGKTQFAVQTQHLIEQETQFEALICAGAAGSLGGGPTLGDVVVGTSTIEHDYKLRFVSRPLPCYQADPELVDQFQTAASRVDRGFRVYFGAIASGDEDIIAPDRAVEIRQATGALCVAWEGAGAARVARFNGLQFLEMRAITDAANHEAPADFQVNLQRAMPNLARLLWDWCLARRQGSPTDGCSGRSSSAAEP
jgi:adenosylhomocysteine nucleosidase